MNLTRRIIARNLLLATVLSVAASGLATATALMTAVASLPAAYAQQTLAGGNNNGNATSTAGNFTLSGIITSTQMTNAGAPLWLSAGSWALVTDMPVFGGNNQTQPTVKNFSAVVNMVLLSNGTMFHTHHISNFKQSEVLFQGSNTTAFNGTMTVTTEEGMAENVPGYLHFQNNIMSVWVNPGQIDNHFGPTPINGMMLTPEQLEELGAELPQLQQGAAAQNSTAASASSSSGAQADRKSVV